MKDAPQDRRVRKTKKALIKGFAALLAEKNIKDISVRELTEAADVNRGTFYLHYKDIYDLQEQIENEVLQEVIGNFEHFKPAKYGQGPFMILETILTFFYENAELCRTLSGNNADRSFLDKLSLILQQQCMDLWMDEFGLEANKKEMEYFGAYMIAGYLAGIRKWTAEGMKEPPKEVAALLSRIGLYGTHFLSLEK